MTKVLRYGAGAVGVMVMVVAVLGILRDRAETHPIALVGWLGGSIALNDFFIAPIVLLIGVAVVRLVPAVVRPVVVVGLMTAGPVLFVGLPVLYASHLGSANPTVLPLDYSMGLLLTLLAVAVLTAFGAAVALLRARGRRGLPFRPPAQD